MDRFHRDGTPSLHLSVLQLYHTVGQVVTSLVIGPFEEQLATGTRELLFRAGILIIQYSLLAVAIVITLRIREMVRSGSRDREIQRRLLQKAIVISVLIETPLFVWFILVRDRIHSLDAWLLHAYHAVGLVVMVLLVAPFEEQLATGTRHFLYGAGILVIQYSLLTVVGFILLRIREITRPGK